jgi:potassium-transporting ATPase KdpC subunit
MLRQLIPALRMALFITLLTGIAYPLLVTAVCQSFFRRQANGSLLEVNGRIIGSLLIGQDWAGDKYFHSRPSAAGNGYDAMSSGGSNLGPTSQKLADRVRDSAAQFRKQNPDYHGPIPADLITASGSGLDPDISPASAEAQAARVAKAQGLPLPRVREMIQSHTVAPSLGFIGEPRVNVMRLNLDLDSAATQRQPLAARVAR